MVGTAEEEAALEASGATTTSPSTAGTSNSSPVRASRTHPRLPERAPSLHWSKPPLFVKIFIQTPSCQIDINRVSAACPIQCGLDQSCSSRSIWSSDTAHRDIVIDGVERARSKLEHTSLATAFCGATFTIAELQQVYEAVGGVPLDQRNFYRKVQKVPDFIVATDSERRMTRGRPARLFAAGEQTVLSPPLMRPQQPTEEA